MSSKGLKRMRRVVKISAYSICFLILLIVCGIYFILPLILQKNGITYTNKNFDFPGTLKVEGLKIKRSDLIADVHEVEINWSWSALLDGIVEGDYVIVRNGDIRLTASSKNTEPYDSNFLKDILPIRFKKIGVYNLVFNNYDGRDTMQLTVPELLVKNLDLDSIWQVGSIEISGTRMSWMDYSAEVKDRENTSVKERRFSISDIPEYTIKNLKLSDCNFELQSATQKHSFKKINLELNRQKENESFVMAVNQFSLRYQDTFDIDLSLNKIAINNKKEAHIANLVFDFPWLKLNIPQLDVTNDGHYKVDIQLKNSYVNTALATRFFPQLKLPFNHDVGIDFDGKITVSEERIDFKEVAFSLADKTSFKLNGFTNMSDKLTQDLELKVSNLSTSMSDIEKLFDFKRPADVKDIDVKSNITISGKFESMNLEGFLGLNGTASRINGVIAQRNNKHIDLSFNFSSALFDPDRFYDMQGTMFKLTNLRLSGSADLDAKNNLSNLSVHLNSDSINTDAYCYRHPDIHLGYSPKQMSANIKLPGLVNLTLKSPDDIFGPHIRYAGTVESIVPQLSDPDSSTGDFYSEFSGLFANDASATEFKLLLETIQFKPKGVKKTYQSTGMLTAGQTANGDLHLNLAVDNKEMIRFNTSNEFLDWWKRSDKWKGNFPTTNLDVSAEIDSNLLYHLTGLQGKLQLKSLQVMAHKDTFKAAIDLPAFRLDSFELRVVQGHVESVAGNTNGQLTAARFKNPLTLFSDIKIQATHKDDRTTGISFTTFLPEIKNNFEFNGLVQLRDSSYLFNLDDKVMQLGTYAWENMDSKGFVLDNDFNLVSGDLRIVNGNQNIKIETNANWMTVSLDSLRLEPIVRLITNDSFFNGALSLNAGVDLLDNSIECKGALSQLQIDKKELGSLNFEGKKNGETFNGHVFMNEEFGKLDFLIKKEQAPMQYSLTIDRLDLARLKSDAAWANDFPIAGMVNARLDGTYDNEFKSHGYMGFSNVESYLTENRIYLNIKEDTIWFKDADVMARDFKVFDKKGNDITLDGKLTVSSDPKMDFTVRSKEFQLLDPANKGKTIKGDVDVAADLSVRLNHDKSVISGKLNVLRNSNLRYLYVSSVSLDERENEMTFVSFEKLDKANKDSILGIIKPVTTKHLEWDVMVGVDNFNMTVILSETSQDNIKMNASGNVLLKTGSSDIPFLYGTLKSNEGRIVYDAPMVSDVDLKVENMQVTWNGDMADPRITFRGSEIFRISTSEIPGMSNSSSIVPISVIVKVNDKPVDGLDIVFDLNSTDAKVKSWIDALPEDSKQSNAINLLLFGSLKYEQSDNNISMMQALASKMNELSRRNLKSTDLSFYSEKQDVSGNDVKNSNKLGYSFSKGLFNNNVKVTLGGTLDLNNTTVTAKNQSANQGSIQIDYIVSNSPEIVVTTSQRTVYDGAINGEIGKSTVGIIYLKRFKNLFKPKKKKKKA